MQVLKYFHIKCLFLIHGLRTTSFLKLAEEMYHARKEHQLLTT